MPRHTKRVEDMEDSTATDSRTGVGPWALPPVAIRQATLVDVDTMTEVLVEAFLVSPVGDWLIPDVATRRGVYEDYFRLHGRHGLEMGKVDITTDGNAVAVWWPDHLAAIPPDYSARLAAACGPWLRRFALMDKVFDRHHPDLPHNYPPFVAVAPQLQGQGVGSALLAHHHAVLDAAGQAAYLEASTDRSRRLYERHGYQLRQDAVTLPEDGPPIWPMWREPLPGSSNR
jgi:GNAT superfamily N-acetyltransferase